jgi:hypothetical protein
MVSRTWTVKQLKQYCAEHDIKNYSKYDRKGLIDYMVNDCKVVFDDDVTPAAQPTPKPAKPRQDNSPNPTPAKAAKVASNVAKAAAGGTVPLDQLIKAMKAAGINVTI